MKNQKFSQEPCCPKFNPEPWDEKTLIWNGKPFIKDQVTQLFHIPLNIKQVIARMWKKVQDANAAPPNEEFLILAFDPSPWKSELYMTVTKNVQNAENIKLSGTFLTKVFDGPYNAVPKWIKSMEQFVASKEKKTKKYYFHFPTCPKCAKIYGKNYAIAFAEVE